MMLQRSVSTRDTNSDRHKGLWRASLLISVDPALTRSTMELTSEVFILGLGRVCGEERALCVHDTTITVTLRERGRHVIQAIQLSSCALLLKLN